MNPIDFIYSPRARESHLNRAREREIHMFNAPSGRIRVLGGASLALLVTFVALNLYGKKPKMTPDELVQAHLSSIAGDELRQQIR